MARNVFGMKLVKTVKGNYTQENGEAGHSMIFWDNSNLLDAPWTN